MPENQVFGRAGGGGGVTGFPILYRKRKFIEILPEISDFYNFDEVFAHF